MTRPDRIQIFDKDGRFKFQFGECGKRDGQLLYPNRVAAVRSSGDIIVTERSPTHQVNLASTQRVFLDIRPGLERPKGLSGNLQQRSNTYTNLTIRVDLFQVQIYNQYGQFVRKFGANILQHPRGVCVDSKGRIIVVECKVMRVIIFDQVISE